MVCISVLTLFHMDFLFTLCGIWPGICNLESVK